MKQDMPRSFTLSNAMVLIVAVAAGLAITRSFGDFMTVRREVSISYRTGPSSNKAIGVSTSDYVDRSTAVLFRPRIKGEIIYWSRQLSFWPGPCLVALSLVTAGSSLRPPRRRSALLPGVVATTALLMSMAASALRHPTLLMQGHLREWWLEFWFTLPRLAGLAVAVSWITLASTGRWRLVGGWFDRLGVAVGACWIGMAVLDLLATWCWAWI